MSVRFGLLVFCFFLAGSAPAQKLDSLRANFPDGPISVPALLQGWSDELGLRFYFLPDGLEGREVNGEGSSLLLTEALNRALEGTGLGFVFYRDYAVAIAPQRLIGTEYSSGYYAALQRAKNLPEPSTTATKVFRIGSPPDMRPDGKVKLKGRAHDAQTGEGLARTAVYFGQNNEVAVTSDGRGTFEAVLPAGEHLVRVEQLGYEPYEATVIAFTDGELSLEVAPASTVLAEAVVSAKATDANLSGARVSTVSLDPKAIKKLPTLMGEADVVRSLLLVTGVTSVGEGAAGFNVRGGEIDQNLMLQDEMVLFNSSHALGFFSTYNTDLVQGIELHKSVMPAQFGGRLASVLDVQMRDGDFEKWKLKGGAGPVSGRFSVEGPVLKNKASVIAGARASFSDWVLGLTRDPALRNSSASFYDANLRYVHRLGEGRSFAASAYSASDRFVYDRSFGFSYKTLGFQATLKRFWGERAVSRLSAVASDYSSTQTNFVGADGGTLQNGIQYLKLKEHVTLRRSARSAFDFGAEAIYYRSNPGERAPFGGESVVVPKKLPRENGLEAALFGQWEWKRGAAWAIQVGARANHFRLLGPKEVFGYSGAVLPENLTDTARYGGGRTVAQFWSLEPRLSVRYRMGAYHALKLGYSRSSQFVNQIFNTDSPTPTSQFQLSTPYLEPFRAHNAAFGYFLNTDRNRWEFAGEVFYRHIGRLWDYRDFAKLVANEAIETEVRLGQGRSYGFEASAKTNRPLYNGQIGYTYSRAQRQVAGINKGQWYASNFDKPHILNLVFNYQPSLRHTWTVQFTYSTGRPTTAPITSYRLNNNIIVPVYSPRNQARIPDYHRMDISYTIGRGYNKRKTLRSSWNFSVYNVYARKNAFSVFYRQNPSQEPVAYRLAILGTVFPAITLNIETL